VDLATSQDTLFDFWAFFPQIIFDQHSQTFFFRPLPAPTLNAARWGTGPEFTGLDTPLESSGFLFFFPRCETTCCSLISMGCGGPRQHGVDF